MNKQLLFIIFICLVCTTTIPAQQLWTKAPEDISNPKQYSVKEIASGKFNLIVTDLAQLRNKLMNAPREKKDGKLVKGIAFSLPLPDETLLNTSVCESPIWDEKYANQFDQVKTYSLTDPVTKSSQGRITLTSKGISGIIFSEKGTVYIQPMPEAKPGTHVSYFTKDETVKTLPCISTGNGTVLNTNRPQAGDNNRRTYRLTVATTAEYTSWAGGQANAVTYITITMNNVTAVYDRDLNIRFSIISPNSILFTNPATDPYPGGNVFLDDAATNANQTAMDNIIGTANYDVGIVFNNGWDRGYVPPPFGFVCNASAKAKAAAGVSSGTGLNPTAGPQGLAFDFTVIHELGHMFGAPHSYASNVGTCAGFSTASAAFEPGSGSTIMGYAGYPTCNTYTSYGEHYFHAGTIAQIQSYINSAGACVLPEFTGNRPPVVSIPATSYIIPKSTPFALAATGSDPDGNSLIYNWEEMDAGFLTANPPAATNTAGPNFRSFAPSPKGNIRAFPRIYDLVAGTPTPYEVLPSVARTMNFRITARDQSSLGGATTEANVALTVSSSAGPFTITSQTSSVTWAAGSSQSITWNVANTNAAPVNCTVVDILFSVDGGITYPYTLVSSTANDGTETITAPNIATLTGRIKVQAVNNVFFNINTANITVTSGCSANGTTITPADSIAEAAGSSALNLTLNPQYAAAFTPSGTITTANPSTFLTIYNTSGPFCATYGFNGSTRFAVHPFVVATPGTYTFTPTTFGLVYNLYNESFNPLFPCLNFIASNTTTPNTTIGPNVSAAMVPGRRYVLVAGTFSNTFPTLPFNYTVNISGGSIYSNPPNPGGAYSYLYVIVDDATNTVKSIAATADLSNSVTYPGGTSYTVYGLSYLTSSPSLNSFVGGTFTNLKNELLFNTTYCGDLSKNTVKVVALSTYTFTGDGNWNDPANWVNNSVPLSPVPNFSQVLINPSGNGECILNVQVIIPQTSKIIVQPGKKFRVLGNLIIQ